MVNEKHTKAYRGTSSQSILRDGAHHNLGQNKNPNCALIGHCHVAARQTATTTDVQERCFVIKLHWKTLTYLNLFRLYDGELVRSSVVPIYIANV